MLEMDSVPEDDGASDDARLDTDASVICPHCGERVDIVVDPDGGSHQEYVEDCEVCCRPWQVTVSYDAAGDVHVAVEPVE